MADDLYTIQIRYRSEGYDRVSQQYTRLQQNIQGTTQAQTRNNRASQQSARTNSTVQRSARSLATTQGRVRQQFLNTANSIAILDGPLGGIASRFSAFGVLVGRAGIALAAFGAATAALTVAVGRGVTIMQDWEVELAKINAILETTGNQVGMTARDIESFSRSLALATLESEKNIASAASQLLTFRNVGAEVFEDVLRSATDLAALGFGTVESEAVKLAKALEDPRQGLTSLSRAGITFTRQQRQMIISMVDAGREAEAMEVVLDRVNRQVGGAAEAAARDTMAGAWDTIGQAFRRASQQAAEATVEVTGLDNALKAIADSISDFAAGPGSLEDQFKRAKEELESVKREIEALEVVSRDDIMSTAELGGGQILEEEADRRIQKAREELDAVSELFNVEQRRQALAEAEGRADRRAEGIANLQTQLDLRKESLGLSEQENRLRRQFAEEGLFGVDIDQEVDRFVNGLREAGTSHREIVLRAEEYRRELEQIPSLWEEALDVARAEELDRQLLSGVARIRQQVEESVVLNELMQEGNSHQEARNMLQDELLRRQALSIIASQDSTQAQIEVANETLKLLNIQDRVNDSIDEGRREAQALAAETRRAVDAANSLQSAFGGVAAAINSAQARMVGLNAQLRAARAGASSGVARAIGGVAETGETLRQEARQMEERFGLPGVGALTSDTRQMLSELEGLEVQAARTQEEISEVFSGGGRSGGSAGGTQRDVLGEIQQEIQQRQTLLGLRGEERDIMENVFQIQQRLGDQAGEVSDEMVQSLARQMQELEDAEQTQQRLESLEQQLSLERELAGVNEDRARLIQAMGEQYNNLSQSQANALEEQIRQVRELTEAHERLAEAQQRAAQFATDLFMAAVQGGDDFRDTLRNILLQIARMQAMAAFQNLFSGMGSAGGPLSFLLAPSANGNVFSGGKTVPFASGGVVSSPTMFPMRGNETGLMGEAGPEAIMPLSRGKDGKLGVKSDGRSETPQQSPPTIINVMDPEIVGNYLNTTKGERVIMNVLDRNGVTRG